MNRKPTNNTRGANAEERRFWAFTKESDCIVSGHPGPSIVQHCYGETFKHNKVLIGHWFIIPLCYDVDNIITVGSTTDFRAKFGPQCDLWLKHVGNGGFEPPEEVIAAIMDWKR